MVGFGDGSGGLIGLGTHNCHCASYDYPDTITVVRQGVNVGVTACPPGTGLIYLAAEGQVEFDVGETAKTVIVDGDARNRTHAGPSE